MEDLVKESNSGKDSIAKVDALPPPVWIVSACNDDLAADAIGLYRSRPSERTLPSFFRGHGYCDLPVSQRRRIDGGADAPRATRGQWSRSSESSRTYGERETVPTVRALRVGSLKPTSVSCSMPRLPAATSSAAPSSRILAQSRAGWCAPGSTATYALP